MENKIKQAVILAGGMGTRLKPFTDEHAKPMYRFNDKPFIEYLVEQVRDFGINQVLILLGYRAEEIMTYLCVGERFGRDVQYMVTPMEYETGNRLCNAKKQLEDRFLLMYCDNYCPIDFEKLVVDAFTNDADVQISAYSNKDNYTKNNVYADTDGKVIVYDKSRKCADLNCVDIGYAIVKKELLELFSEREGIYNFEREVYGDCVLKGSLYATVTEHRYYSIGSWERIELTKQFFSREKTIFIDRDGTINKRPPKAQYVQKPEDFIWLNRAEEGIALLKKKGYRVLLVSNQPGIARGALTEKTLDEIHKKMQEDLRKDEGCEIDDLFVCPHNWDDGCDCRKPKPGMFYQAQKKYSLNLHNCIMIGDDERDIEAGNAAGCTCFQVTDENSLFDIANKIVQGDM